MNEYRYEDIHIGMTESFSVRVTEEMMDSFRGITGDINPLHNDEAYAHEQGYDARVVYGMLTSSFLSTLAGVYLPGRRSLIRSVECKFPAPVLAGDELTITGEVTDMNDDYRFITLKVSIRNQQGVKVCRGKMEIGVTE